MRPVVRSPPSAAPAGNRATPVGAARGSAATAASRGCPAGVLVGGVGPPGADVLGSPPPLPPGTSGAMVTPCGSLVCGGAPDQVLSPAGEEAQAAVRTATTTTGRTPRARNTSSSVPGAAVDHVRAEIVVVDPLPVTGSAPGPPPALVEWCCGATGGTGGRARRGRRARRAAR